MSYVDGFICVCVCMPIRMWSEVVVVVVVVIRVIRVVFPLCSFFLLLRLSASR